MKYGISSSLLSPGIIFRCQIFCSYLLVQLIGSRSLLGRSNHKIVSIAGVFILLISGYFIMAIMVAFFMMRTDDREDSLLDDVSPLSTSRKLGVLVYLGMMILTLVSLSPF